MHPLSTRLPDLPHAREEVVERASNAELTTTHQSSDAPNTIAQGSLDDPPPRFSFPSIAEDGSVHEHATTSPPPRHPTTPPAALSSKGAALAAMALQPSASTSSLNDSSYDMMEDVSEIQSVVFSDDHDTVSLPSEPRESDDGMVTPDDTGSIVDVEEEHEDDITLPITFTGVIGSFESLPGVQIAQQNLIDARMKEENSLLDSYLNEDLETPRQSVHRTDVERPIFSKSQEKIVTPTSSSSPEPRRSKKQESQAYRVLQKSFLPLLMALSFAVFSYILRGPSNTVDELAYRRYALSSAVTHITNSSVSTQVFNVEHLLPPYQPMQGEYQGFTSEARSQGLDPNHIIVSLPKKLHRRYFLKPSTTTVYKSAGRTLDFNLTKLIDGVYDITIHPKDAYGSVSVNMQVKNPSLNITTSHDFGSHFIQRTTTDLSNTLTKDITVARQRVKGFKDLVGLELAAGAAATRNVTTELAVYVARDLQVLANTAVSVFTKAIVASNETFAKIHYAIAIKTKEALSKVHRDVHRAKKTFQSSKGAAKRSAKVSRKYLRDGLIASRAKALNLKKRFMGQKDSANSTTSSATKELSLRLQNLFHPTEKTKRAGSLPDIARCARAKDYKACRREQRKQAVALANVVEKAVLAREEEKKAEAKVAPPATVHVPPPTGETDRLVKELKEQRRKEGKAKAKAKKVKEVRAKKVGRKVR